MSDKHNIMIPSSNGKEEGSISEQKQFNNLMILKH